MHAMINMALRAGRRASQIIVRAMDRIDTLTIVEKDRNDFVSEVDRDAEDAIVETLHKAYPDHGIVGEERGESFAGAEYTWVIDPLDGTTNYLHGVPHFAVSIGLKYRNRLEHAVVIDPVRNEEFVASRGGGAQLNGKRIRVSSRNRIDDALLATGIPFRDVAEHLDAYMAMLKTFTAQCRGIRRAGSAALDLAYVAAGRYDGFWELGLKPWDMAAGALLIWEAGGFVSDLVGGERFMDTGNIVTGNPKVFKAMLQNIRPTLSPALARG
ncbi:MAG TPA: inositol monophosphatase family protein [Pseudomonadales bacterium]|nr:inositol monophosphatase family protein [Pseudomonadales bacterium]